MAQLSILLITFVIIDSGSHVYKRPQNTLQGCYAVICYHSSGAGDNRDIAGLRYQVLSLQCRAMTGDCGDIAGLWYRV